MFITNVCLDSLERASNIFHRCCNDVQLSPTLSAGCNAGDGAREVSVNVGEEPVARAEVTSGCQGAAHGIRLNCFVVLLSSDNLKVVLELQVF